MADNLTVLNSTGATATLRMKDTTGSGGPLANMSVPTDTTGNPMSVLAGATVTSTAQGASVIVISSLSPSHLITPSSAVSITGTVTLSSVAQVTLTSNTVTLSSNPTLAGGTVATVTSMTSGTVVISNGSNLANVIAGSSAVTSTMAALVVALSSNGFSPTISTITSITSGSIAITNGSNTAAVKAASTAPLATDPALVVALSPNSINANGRALSSNSAPVVFASQLYNSIAASQSSQALTGGSGGTIGDWLDFLLVVPASTSPGNVLLSDGSTNVLTVFAGGSGVVASLVPFAIPIRAVSASSAWKITTGANVSIIASGNFH